MSERRFKAAVFDLDGTLLDTLLDLASCADAAMRAYGFPEHTVEQYRGFIGNGMPKLIARACPAGTDEKTLSAALDFFLAEYAENCAVHTAFYPAVEKTIAELKRRGYNLAVLTNKTEAPAKKIIDHYFPDAPFSIVWGNNGRRALKPAPDAGELLLKELGCRADEVFYMGDGDTDMLFAKRMGFFAAGAAWGYRPRAVLRECGAERIFENIGEILTVLP